MDVEAGHDHIPFAFFAVELLKPRVSSSSSASDDLS
jgi:hypothetical protein